jgi:hypothetical protein
MFYPYFYAFWRNEGEVLYVAGDVALYSENVMRLECMKPQGKAYLAKSVCDDLSFWPQEKFGIVINHAGIPLREICSYVYTSFFYGL